MSLKQILLRYLGRFLWLWGAVCVALVFTVLTAADYLFASFEPAPYVAATALALSFLAAIARLVIEMAREIQSLTQHIEESDAAEANIRLKCTEANCDPPHSHETPPFPDIAVNEFGFDEHGLPGWATVWATIEAKNIGWRDGFMIFNLDTKGTDLPHLLRVDAKDLGAFDGRPSDKYEPQERRELDWSIHLRISEPDPHLFAESLNSLGRYHICAKYCTERFDDSLSQLRDLVIEGDFGEFRQKVLEYWHYYHQDLAQIARSQ